MNNYTLHFTLGPVQSFVGQARRTRDLWAGSFLLSWLAGQAMNAVIKADGKIVFPVVYDTENKQATDPLLKAIRNADKEIPNEHYERTPSIGTLPNRFKAQFKKEQSSNDIQKIVNAVTDKWENLANAVWREYVQDIAMKYGCKTDNSKTQEIFHEQISNFWEINWVLAATPNDKTDGKWLDLRKNWRSHLPKKQKGDHCTLMGDWQEISGYIHSHEQQQQKEFWGKIRNQQESGTNKKLGYLELREGERLCAISLVKRLFPRLSKASLKSVIGWIPGGTRDKVGNWPSTAYMAAIPWLSYINDDENKCSAMTSYATTVASGLKQLKTFPKLCSERATKISNLENIEKIRIGETAGSQRNATDLDGNLFHLDTLQNHRNTPLSDKDQDYTHDPDKNTRKSFVSALKALNKAIGGNDAQPFYSLLVMDGDNMGKLLQNPDIDSHGIQAISESLMNFSLKAQAIVEKHQGILLYSGGDDVLAMLPITTAINCSIALREDYTRAFESKRKILAKPLDSGKISASTAIIYTHLHTPLNKILKQGHHALDNIAKEQNGRNSLCLTVFKPEGVTAQWVGSFGTEKTASLTMNMQTLINEMKANNSYSTSFFYNLKSRYPMLYDDVYTPPNAEDKAALLLAEYCKGKDMKKPKKKVAANKAVEILLNACGKQKGQDDSVNLNGQLQLDAAYIARFIIDTGHNFGRERGQE